MSPFPCHCGFSAASVVAVMRHIDRGECPSNPPRDSALHAHWIVGIGHRNFVKPMPDDVKARLAALASDPEYRERKRTERKARLDLRRRLSAPRGRATKAPRQAVLFGGSND